MEADAWTPEKAAAGKTRGEYECGQRVGGAYKSMIIIK